MLILKDYVISIVIDSNKEWVGISNVVMEFLYSSEQTTETRKM